MHGLPIVWHDLAIDNIGHVLHWRCIIARHDDFELIWLEDVVNHLVGFPEVVSALLLGPLLCSC